MAGPARRPVPDFGRKSLPGRTQKHLRAAPAASRHPGTPCRHAPLPPKTKYPSRLPQSRLRRKLDEKSGLDFAVYDSVAFACDGPPEAAETVGAYFRAVRQIGVGSLQIAHITKAEGGDRKPFGSAFWHNSARATFFIKTAEPVGGDASLTLGVFNRKANLGGLQAPLGFRVDFDPNTTTFTRTEVADCCDMVSQLSVRQRMASLLRKGPLTFEQIAEETDSEVKSVKRESYRYKKLFMVLPGGKVGLAERRLL